VGAGSTVGEVQAAYPSALREPHKYNPEPAHNLIVWTEIGRRGLRFEIGVDGRVEAVHAGGEAILLGEGCS
jgi:hypothetical protein